MYIFLKRLDRQNLYTNKGALSLNDTHLQAEKERKLPITDLDFVINPHILDITPLAVCKPCMVTLGLHRKI